MFNLPAVGGGKKVFSNELWMSNPGTARFNSSIGTEKKMTIRLGLLLDLPLSTFPKY